MGLFDWLFGPPRQKPAVSAPFVVAPKELPWMEEMRKVKGLHETRDNAKLRAWLKSDGATVGDPDQIPWCGDGVQTAIKLALPSERVPDNPWASINWTKWGLAVTPQYGCVLVFWRGKSAANWEGHVAFYVGEDDTYFYVLGANQQDAVSVTKVKKSQLRAGGSRWPINGPRPTGKVVRMTGMNEATSLA